MASFDELLADLGNQLKSRLQPVPNVPKDFNPLKASQEELRRYAYPSRPPSSNTVAREIWTRMVSAPIPPDNWQAPVLPLVAGPIPYSLNFNAAGFRGRNETSQNWSGVVTHSSDEPPFQTVFGMWQVPAVTAPAGASEGVVYSCSAWVGLDGYEPTSLSLPQIGSTQSVKIVKGRPVVTYETWWQWWLRGLLTVPVPITPSVPVQAGDLMACSVEITGRHDVVFCMTNLSNPVLPPYRLPVSPPPIIGVYYLWSTAGTTAEWIAERPRNVNPPQELYGLPEFDTVTFTGAAVSSSAVHRDFRPARIIRMVENLPDQCVVISRTNVPGPTGIAIVGPGVEERMGGGPTPPA
jgi:hypothetical protein